MIHKRLKEIVEATALAYGCEGELNYLYELAVTENSQSLYPCAFEAVKKAGGTPVVAIPSTGGEDFSEYLATGTPGFFYWVGVRNETKDCVYSWHSPKYKVDEDFILIGVGTFVMTVFEGMNHLRKENKGE